MKRWWFACLILTGALGCAGTESGNPGSTSMMSIQGRSSNPAEIAFFDDQSALDVRVALISFTDLSLIPCGEVDERPLAAPMVVDLGTSAPVRFSVANAPRTACGLRLSLGPALRGPPEILDHTVLIRGVRSSDGVPFNVSSIIERQAELVTLSGTGFDPRELVIAFDLAVWFAEVDVHGVEPLEGTVNINAGATPDLVAAFEGRIGLAAEVFIDENANGVLDECEVSIVARGSD
jgi:hypothetical protein